MALPATSIRPSPQPALDAVRWRAVLLGVFLTVAINGFDPISRYMIRSSALTNSHMPFALLTGLLLLALLYNPIARSVAPRFALTRQDLAAILCVSFVGAGLSNYSQWLVGSLTRPDYLASPENEWPTYVIPNLKPWLFPTNARGGVAAFYDGIAPGDPIPWDIWMVPLFWWLTIFSALMVACVCTGVMLRKQWSQRERLAFPLVEMPLLLIQDPPPGKRFPGYFSDRLFWIGFGIPAVVLSWNIVGHFQPGFPTFAFVNSYNFLHIARGFMPYYLRFDFYIISFAYFTPLNILFSMWFFHVIGMTQDGISKRIGFGPEGYGAGVITQNNYGLMCFVLWGIWIARGHLHDIWRKTIGRGDDVDDSEEILSYRTACCGWILSVCFIYFWLRTTQMSSFVALTFMLFVFVLYLGMAKIVALSGLVCLRGSGSTGPVKDLIGIRHMDDITVAALNQMGTLYGQAKGFAMPGSANSVKASESTGISRRRLGYAALVAGMLGLITFIVVSLLLGYIGPGAGKWSNTYFWTGAQYNYTVSDIKNRADETWEWWWTFGFGAWGILGTALLIWLNQRFTWWPIHPVGFTVSLQWPTRASFFSILIAWLVKSIVLRVGGINLYNRSRTFFVGMLLGYASGVALGFILDVFFFMGQGHGIHWPPL